MRSGETKVPSGSRRCRAHSILIDAYHIRKHKQAYLELGDDYFDRLNAARTVRHLTKRLKKLGFEAQRIPA